MDHSQLTRLHMALECIGVNAAGRLVRIPGLDPDTLHRVYVTQHAGGDTFYFHERLPGPLCEALRGIPVEAYFDDPERIKAALAEDGPCEEIHIGKSYVFPPAISPADFPDVVRISQLPREVVERYDPGLVDCAKEVFAVLAGGEIASTCESSRENDQAGEAWVRTLEAHRRRGFARQVTAAWGYWLVRRGKVPFYSHRQENLASQAVAQSLGLLKYIDDAGYA